jgi:hypothetical protein
MASALTADLAPGRARRSRRALVTIEARRSLTVPWLWLGIAASTWFSYSSAGADFAGGAYLGLMSSFAGVAASLFVIGVLAGGRDHTPGGLLAPDAPLDSDERALSRLLGLWPAWSVAVLYAGVVFAIQRVEGGMWIADWPVGGNEAVFSVVEMLQPPILFVVTATAGVALGRASAHRTIVSVTGALVIAASGVIYWAWQWVPAVWVTLIQAQPIEVRLGADFSPNDAPATWMLSAPDRYQPTWGRVMLHQALAAWHLVYLVGLATMFVGFAVRGRRGRVAAATGVAVLVTAVIAQLVVTPAGFAGA